VARNGLGSFNGGLSVNTTNGGLTRLTQFSITANTANIADVNIKTNGLLLYSDSKGGSTYLSNSVVWGNATDFDTKDISLSGSGIYLDHVHYGGITGSAPASNTNPGSGDPGFVAPGDPHLGNGSVLIDTGNPNPNGNISSWDVEGRTRVEGVAVDVGAYEWHDRVFADGFDQ